jgi:hypothetical protein
MFAGLPPSSSDLAERKSVVPPSPPAGRRANIENPTSSSVFANKKPPIVGRDLPTLAACRCISRSKPVLKIVR